jgi:tetratricopeptide (TPR) repeat protein
MSQNATVTEENVVMKTYPFFDPNPVISPDRIYPYFRFDGYTREGKDQEWKMVILENEYIKVFVCPDIGGKIWGAIEKSTGKEFIYFNHSVKFRDVAMRGAWSSGGLEYNFGDIGHIPTCATPVDYVTKEYDDGSVACIVGAIDLPSGTKWNVEIKLQKDKAYFETIASWHNTSNLPVTYYHWMNAAAKADGNLEFIYPGNKRIGHGGEIGEWPFDEGRDISMYENNDFGIYKSYHVINAYSGFFGGYWHDDEFGFGHYSNYDEKPGKKIWIWGLSDQGMIWEDLLTDGDGQYIEYQAGKLFNQAAHSSTFTPFKHREFLPYDSDIMKEIWFPLKNTGGMVAASEYGVLNTKTTPGMVEVRLSPLQKLHSKLKILSAGKLIYSEDLNLQPLQLYVKEIQIDESKPFSVEVGNKQLFYSSGNDEVIDRPVESVQNFNWQSAYGHYTAGLELEKQRRYAEAIEEYETAYGIEPGFLPVVNRLAMSAYREMEYNKALNLCKEALSIDTYSSLANYVFGLVNNELDKMSDAKSGFSIAVQSLEYRSAAYLKLAELFLKERNMDEAINYANKALDFNRTNLSALEVLAMCYRLLGDMELQANVLDRLKSLDACNAFVAYEESYNAEEDKKGEWSNSISNELVHETYLDLAIHYYNVGLNDEAVEVLESAPEHPMVVLWLAYLDNNNRKELLERALELSAENIYPHRNSTLKVITRLMEETDHWKLKYYAGIIFWKLNRLDNAKELFSTCGIEPDFVAFYLSKIKLFDGELAIEQDALVRAAEINGEDWRLNRDLIDFYIRTNDLEKAERLALKFHRRYPENSQFGMTYAKNLMAQKKYSKCLSFLEKFNVLPYEGATEGRNIYHETCLRLAFDCLKKGNYSKAISYGQKAKLWPLNLGVGKHYDVDERLDNFVIAMAYEKLNNKQEADIYYNKVVNHSTPSYLNESSKLYVQALAFARQNKKAEAERLVLNAKDKEPDNDYLQWVKSEFIDQNGDIIARQLINENIQIQAYDTRFVDKELGLVLDFINIKTQIK